MFEEDDGPRPQDDIEDVEDVDQQFFAALTLLCLAVLAGAAWVYLALTRGVHGPPQ